MISMYVDQFLRTLMRRGLVTLSTGMGVELRRPRLFSK